MMVNVCLILQEMSCVFNENTAIASISDMRYIEQGNESDLQAAVATIGPAVVVIDHKRRSFQVIIDTKESCI